MVDYHCPLRHQECNYFSHFLTGFCASTLTNPIWLIKTRLQLDRASGQKILSIRSCIANIHQDLVSYTKVVKIIENWLFWRIFSTFFFREFEVFGKVLQPRIGELVKLWFTLWYMNIWRNSWLWCRIKGKMMKKRRLILHVSCFVELVLKPVLPLLHTLMVSQFMIFYAFYVSWSLNYYPTLKTMRSLLTRPDNIHFFIWKQFVNLSKKVQYFLLSGNC